MKKTLLSVFSVVGSGIIFLLSPISHREIPVRPVVAPTIQPIEAMLQVAKVFGRAQGCTEADSDLIETVAQSAVDNKLDPSIAASIVATESGCNQYAVSSRGAIGLTQIMPKTWSGRYDFSGRINLLNRRDNVRTGVEIAAELIRQYGLPRGIQKYNGDGIGCASCDGNYSAKILSLARK